MHNLILWMTFLLSLLGSQSLAASPFEQPNGSTTLLADLLAEDLLSGRPPTPSIQRLDSRAAAAQVKQRYQTHKILSIKLIEGQGPGVYRVKTLSPQGVVKYVFVDDSSGSVFE